MKKLLSLCICTFGLCFALQGYAASETTQQMGQDLNRTYDDQQSSYGNDYRQSYGSYSDGQYDGQYGGQYGCANGQCGYSGGQYASVDHHQYAGQEYCCGDVQEHPCGKCYCLYCCYQPCYYNEWHT